MACGGCAERREAIVRAAVALADGNSDAMRAELKRFTQSAAVDMAKVKDHAVERARARMTALRQSRR